MFIVEMENAPASLATPTTLRHPLPGLRLWQQGLLNGKTQTAMLGIDAARVRQLIGVRGEALFLYKTQSAWSR